jgi:hypothetical protein
MEKQAVHDGAEGWMLEREAAHHVAPERHVVRDQPSGGAIPGAAPHAVEERGDLAGEESRAQLGHALDARHLGRGRPELALDGRDPVGGRRAVRVEQGDDVPSCRLHPEVLLLELAPAGALEDGGGRKARSHQSLEARHLATVHRDHVDPLARVVLARQRLEAVDDRDVVGRVDAVGLEHHGHRRHPASLHL